MYYWWPWLLQWYLTLPSRVFDLDRTPMQNQALTTVMGVIEACIRYGGEDNLQAGSLVNKLIVVSMPAQPSQPQPQEGVWGGGSVTVFYYRQPSIQVYSFRQWPVLSCLVQPVLLCLSDMCRQGSFNLEKPDLLLCFRRPWWWWQAIVTM